MRTPEQHQRVKEVLLAALERESAQRTAFLDQACAGDTSLRAEVETLLTRQKAAQNFIEDSPFAEVETEARWTGRLLDGRYLIERELGRGGMGLVLLAHDQKLHQTPVVIKVLLENILNHAHKDWIEKKFKQEIAALTRINHPGVVSALDVGQLPDGRTYLVMQYVPGVGLRSTMPPHGMPLARVANLIRQMGQALAAAHAQGVIHRDLKPENIILQIVGDEEHVMLIDFGIASVLDSLEQAGIKTTMAAGTPDYMAPEQLRGKPTAASDLYALGVIAYEIVTGRRPFKATTHIQLLEQQRAGVSTAPCAVRLDLPAAAQAVILKALSFTQQERYASAKEFSEALARALTGEVDNPALTPKLRANKLARRWLPRALLMALLMMVLLAGVGAFTWWLYVQKATRQTATRQTALAPERSLSYSLLVRKDPKRYPGSKPFLLPGEIIFEAGYQVRLNVSSPQPGYLYVINEGPAQTAGLPDLIVLFPVTTSNGGAAEIKANQPVQLPPPSGKPEQDWFRFDEEEGVEKIWLVWAERIVPELEAVKERANPRERGVISDPSQIRAVAQYLATQAAHKPETEKDEVRKQTKLKGQGAVLVSVVKLEHH